MAAFILFVLAVGAIIVFVASRRSAKRQAFEAEAAANPIHPTLAAALRTTEDWQSRRAAFSAVRSRTDDVLALLARHREALLLVAHSTQFPFRGLLVITQGRTVLFDDHPTEIEHSSATTRIMSTGENSTPWIEVSDGGRVLRFGTWTMQEAEFICEIVDLWADSPEITPDPRVRIGPAGIEIDDAFFADTLRRAGHAVTPFNMRSIHERFGMQLHHKAARHIGTMHGAAAEQRLLAAVGRPADDRDLPGWSVRVMREWSSFDDGIAPLVAFFPLWVRWFLLDTARTDGGYLAHPDRPLCMWRSDQYEGGGGARRSIPA